MDVNKAKMLLEEFLAHTEIGCAVPLRDNIVQTLAALDEPVCKTCGGSGEIEITTETIDKPKQFGWRPCFDCHSKKLRDAYEDTFEPKPEQPVLQINMQSRPDPKDARSYKPEQSGEFVKSIRQRINDSHYLDSSHSLPDFVDLATLLLEACRRIEQIEAEKTRQTEHIKLLQDCDDSSTEVIGQMGVENKQLRARIAELESTLRFTAKRLELKGLSHCEIDEVLTKIQDENKS